MKYFNTSTKTEFLNIGGLAEDLPSDVVELEDDNIFFSLMPDGKVIEFDGNGIPVGYKDLPPVTPSSTELRDSALAAVAYDFGDGRIMQARLSDKSGIELGIALGITQWKMADNKRWPVTTEELQTVLAYGISEGAKIWLEHLAALPAGE